MRYLHDPFMRLNKAANQQNKHTNSIYIHSFPALNSTALFINQGRIKLIKGDGRDIYNITNDLCFQTIMFF